MVSLLTLNGGAKYKGVAIFDQYAAVSEMVIDRGIYYRRRIQSRMCSIE